MPVAPLLIAISSAQAAFLGGVAFVPPGVGAFAFDDSNGFSGTLASEWDGWLRPPLTAHAGWANQRHAVLGNLAVVQTISDSYAENTHTYTVGGLRIGADWRYCFWPRESGSVNAWPTAGVFGTLPNSTETDTSWTIEEQDQAEEDSRERRARIGGVGAQAGLGVDYTFGDKAGNPAVILGARWTVKGFGGLDLAETETDFSVLMVSEAALLLEFTR